jgi:hypothetical protein
MQNHLLTVCLVAVTAVMAFCCAGQVTPSGGPPDKTPPEILETVPPAGALNVHTTEITLTFSKYVDPRTLEESIFFSPSLGELTFDWGGKSVTIRFADSLRPATTYIMTVGTDLKDTRSNTMAKAFALPFGTGGQLDSGSISGKVVDEQPTGVMVFAYRLDKGRADTLNPCRVKPDYLTQTGKDGSFELPYLALGTYRLLAIRDELKNLLYDVQQDRYGTASADVQLTASAPVAGGVQFRMTAEDTTAPFLSSARPLSSSRVLFRFSKGMAQPPRAAEQVAITDTLSGTSLQVLDVSLVLPDGKEAQVVTAQQDSGRGYRVRLQGFRDRAGNLMREEGSRAVFSGASFPDTDKPVVEFRDLRENEINVPLEDSIHITFSIPVRKSSLEAAFSMKDSSGGATQGIFLWKNSLEVSFRPAGILPFDKKFTVRIRLDSLHAISGRSFGDSLVERHFQTVDEKQLSSLQGTVVDGMQGASGRIYIIAVNISSPDVKPRTAVVDSPGVFRMDRLFEGKYTLWGFRDTDSSGSYTYGKPSPFHASERFATYPDTLRLRARWPLEGVVVRFH